MLIVLDMGEPDRDRTDRIFSFHFTSSTVKVKG